MKPWFRFRVTYQTIRDNWKITIILTILFMATGAMYCAIYPAYKDMMPDLADDFGETMAFIPGSEDMASYVGFMNIELYQIFWILILGILIGFISATLISKEIEGKTIDLFMSNPISRPQIVLEKYFGIIPLMLIINFTTMISIYGTTLAINEELNFSYLFLTHVVSIPYFLAIISVGLLVSVIIDEKIKASIIMIAIIVGMYILRSISLMIPDYKPLGYISLANYFKPYNILKAGKVDLLDISILLVVTIICLLLSILYFRYRDIAVS